MDKKCREYLWGAMTDKKKISLVSWEAVCHPKTRKGLNIKNCRAWNIACVGKLLRLLITKKDSLWIKWVHELYMKDHEDICTHKASPKSSWYWRKIHSLKDSMKNWYINGRYKLTLKRNYSIARSYVELIGE